MRRIKDNLQLSVTNGMLSISHPDYPMIMEVPIKPEDTIEYTKEYAIREWIRHTTAMPARYFAENGSNMMIRDDTYMNGSICRVDYTIGTAEGNATLLKIEDEFPDVYIDKDDAKALFTTYSSARYANEIFGIYQWHRVPDDLIEKYKLDEKYDNYDVFSPDMGAGLEHFNLQPSTISAMEDPGKEDAFELALRERNRAIGISNSWYGLKIDRTTKHIQLKVVVPYHQIDSSIRDKLKESFPGYYLNNEFFATLHNEDGTISPELDWYFSTNTASLMEWCETNDMPFPYPEEMITELEGKTMCFGIVYDTEEEKFKHVKAYIRNFL